MKLILRGFAAASLLLTASASMSISAAATLAPTIAITNPGNNTQNLYCTVPVQAQVTPQSGYSVIQVKLRIMSSTGTQTDVSMMSIASNTYEHSWNTLNGINGAYTLQAFADYVEQATMKQSTVASALVNVTVKNGATIITDTAKTYAKVLSPTQGAVINQGTTFTVNTDHNIMWQRHDNCSMIMTTVEWTQSTSWKPVATAKTSGSITYTIPQTIGEHGVAGSLINTYPAALPTGQFTADAWSATPAGNRVAHSANSFTIQ